MPMDANFLQCCYCKKKTKKEDINSFGECPKCYGKFMTKFREGKSLFPEKARSKYPKKGRWSSLKRSKKTKTGGEGWRGYNNVKEKDLASPIDETPTQAEEKELTEKV